MPQETDLKETLRRLMEQRGLTERSLASRAGMGPTGVRDILLGKSVHPRRDTLKKIAAALEIPVEQLLRDDPLSPADEMRAVSAFRRLPPKDRRRFLALLEMAAADAEADQDE